jgi:hypothetical protein
MGVCGPRSGEQPGTRSTIDEACQVMHDMRVQPLTVAAPITL